MALSRFMASSIKKCVLAFSCLQNLKSTSPFIEGLSVFSSSGPSKNPILESRRMSPPLRSSSIDDDFSIAIELGTKERFGFAFSPGGLLFPYQLGVAKALVETGLLTDKTPISGASAGALVSVVAAANIDFAEALDGCGEILAECAAKGGAQYNIRGALESQLNDLLPLDVADLLNNRPGGCGVVVTEMSPLPRGRVVTEFRSRRDVVELLLASCCVPFWFTPGPAIMCRGRPHVDGFFAFPREAFGCPDLGPAGAATTVRVLPFPSASLGMQSTVPGDILSPDIDPEFPYAFQELLALALSTYDGALLRGLHGAGEAHAGRWAAALIGGGNLDTGAGVDNNEEGRERSSSTVQ
ncbi:unnamed protein product [Heterosigma akashiwo]